MATEDKRIDQLPGGSVYPENLMVMDQNGIAVQITLQQLLQFVVNGWGEQIVKYVDQTPTEEQQHQARKNIRCGSIGVVSSSCVASGAYAHAEGHGTKAIGRCSHTQGLNTEAIGEYSSAEGDGTKAIGWWSHAQGLSTEAEGRFAHAEGYRTKAIGRGSHVQGEYNTADYEDKYAHIVGNGTGDDARSNAHTLDWDGVPWYAGDRVMLGGTGMDDENAVALMPIFAPQQLTEAQKQQARDNIGAVQQYPFVDSVSQMTDINKEYVLSSTGEIWKYQLVKGEALVTPNFTNLFDKSKVILNKVYNAANNPPEDWDGGFLTGPYAYDFTNYDVSNPTIVRIKGAQEIFDLEVEYKSFNRVAYYRYSVPVDITTENFRIYTQFNSHIPYTIESDGTIAFPLVLKKDGSTVGDYNLMQAFAFSFNLSDTAITLNDIPDLIVTIDEEITYTATPGVDFYEWRSTGEKYVNEYIENRFTALEKDVSNLKTREEETVFSNFSCENDFTIVGDEIWGSKNEDTYTRIVRHKIVDGALVKLGEITLSDVIHLNTMDYCPENDCLITANGANDQNTEGNCFWIIPDASKLPDLEGTLSLADIAIRYDVDIGYKVQAIWGNGNLGQHNLVYLCSNDKEVREAIIHKNTDGSFANTYTIVSDPFAIEGAAGYQGMDYYGGSIYFGCADFALAKTNTHNFTAEVTKYKYFNTDGTAIDGVFQGVVVDKDYLWLYPSGTTELIRLTR